MSPDATKKSPKTATNEPQELEDQICLRADELYEEGGREDGHEQEDWLRAKEEITIKKFRTATALTFAHIQRKRTRPRPSGPF